MIPADFIVTADNVLTMDAELRTIRDAAIAIGEGRILAVDTAHAVLSMYSSPNIIGGKGRVVFPGFVNTHTHSPMVFFRGLGDDLPLKTWLEEHIWPAEEKWLSPEFVTDAAELACLEMLTAGITLYNDMYFFGDVISATTKRLGMRAVVGAGILDFPSRTAATTDEYFSHAEDFIIKWKGDGLIVPAVAPHAPYTCSPETLKRAKRLSEKHNVPVHIHLSETEWEKNEVMRRYGKAPVELLESLGVLDEMLVAAHCVWVTDREISMLSEKKVSVSHCIESNLKLAAGFAPVLKMLAEGVRVTLGTDGAASNNDLNIIGEMGTAAKVHKALSADPTVMNARQVMLMATRWGAEALGLGSITGSITQGMSADIVIADMQRPHLAPMYDVYSQLVYAMRPSDIEHVLVRGRVVVENGTLITADAQEILRKASAWGRKIRP